MIVLWEYTCIVQNIIPKWKKVRREFIIFEQTINTIKIERYSSSSIIHAEIYCIFYHTGAYSLKYNPIKGKRNF